MAFDIFQVDWITFDIVVILLLITLLIGVRLLKEIFRWRFLFSNVSTVRKLNNHLNLNNNISSVSIKKCSLNNSSDFQQEHFSNPTIFLIRRSRKLMLLKALTEAFSTSGYNVINLRLKMSSKNKRERLKSDIEKELPQIFSYVLMYYNNNVNSLNPYYNVIDFTKKVLPLNILLKDHHCRNIILVNPCLNSFSMKVYVTLINDSNEHSKLITVFSEKLNPFFKNKNVKKITIKNETFKYNKQTIIQKARSSFKYYETFLLGVLIRYIEEQ